MVTPQWVWVVCWVLQETPLAGQLSLESTSCPVLTVSGQQPHLLLACPPFPATPVAPHAFTRAVPSPRNAIPCLPPFQPPLSSRPVRTFLPRQLLSQLPPTLPPAIPILMIASLLAAPGLPGHSRLCPNPWHLQSCSSASPHRKLLCGLRASPL